MDFITAPPPSHDFSVIDRLTFAHFIPLKHDLIADQWLKLSLTMSSSCMGFHTLLFLIMIESS